MQRKTLTILFVDLQGYSSRTAQQSRTDNDLLLAELRSFIEKHCSEFNGRVVKSMGDGFLLVFDSPTDAVVCGKKMQDQIERRNVNIIDKDNFVYFRIGINTGEVTVDDSGDVFGDAVNIAARIQDFAEPKEIYLSEATYLAMNKSEVPVAALGPQRFKNIAHEIRVYKALEADAQPPSPFPKGLLIAGAVLLAVLAGAVIFWLSARGRSAQKDPGRRMVLALLEDKRYFDALRELDLLRAQDPENIAYVEMTINTLMKLKDFNGMTAILRESMPRLPDGMGFCGSIADLLDQKGQTGIADHLRREVCTIENLRPQEHPWSDDDEIRKILDQRPDIEKLMQKEDWAPIISWAEKLLEKDTLNVEARDILSEVCLRTGDFERARTLLREALAMDPGVPHLLFRLAEVNESMGNNEEALRLFQKSREASDDINMIREVQMRMTELKDRIRAQNE